MSVIGDFSSIPEDEWIAYNDLVFSVFDAYPVSTGHVLVITKRVVPGWFSATRREKTAIFDLIDHVKKKIIAPEYSPDGYNIGMNCGVSAGQTIMHLHVHIIPRYSGDVENPIGGVRGVIRDKADYLEK